jgi:hypothetical protein
LAPEVARSNPAFPDILREQKRFLIQLTCFYLSPPFSKIRFIMIKATLRLFNAVQVDSKHNRKIPQAVFERTIKNGYVVDPSILPENDLLDTIESVVGISGDKANAAFHKSWSVVKSASMESLIIQQIIHYITAYGFEHLGIYREDAVYIPCEALDLPDLKDNIPLTAIKAMDSDGILQRIITLGAGSFYGLFPIEHQDDNHDICSWKIIAKLGYHIC